MKKIIYALLICSSLSWGLSAQSLASASNPLITDGLIAFYPFNGDGTDASGNGYDLDVSAQSFEQDRFKREETAIVMAGDEINTNIGDKGSICLWVKLNGQGTMGIFSGGDTAINNGSFELATFGKGQFKHENGYNVSDYYIEKSGLLFIVKGDWAWTGESNIAVAADNIFDGKWHFIAVTWNGKARVSIYLDGRPVNGSIGTWHGKDTEIKKSPFILGEDLKCGASSLLLGDIRAGNYHFYDKFRPMNGAIDDLRIYSRPLKDSEIQVLFKESLAK
jgi:hypothetical protein